MSDTGAAIDHHARTPEGKPRARAVGIPFSGMPGPWNAITDVPGSVICIVATDAPLFPHQCKTLARRVTLGLARTGTSGSRFSGDLFLAFSTANEGAFTPPVATLFPGGAHYDHLSFVPWGHLDTFYEAVVQSVEEAVVNALVANGEMVGRNDHGSPVLPRERVAKLVAGARRREG